MHSKANRTFNKAIGSPGEQETDGYKCRRHQWGRLFAHANNVSVGNQWPVPEIEWIAYQPNEDDVAVGEDNSVQRRFGPRQDYGGRSCHWQQGKPGWKAPFSCDKRKRDQNG